MANRFINAKNVKNQDFNEQQALLNIMQQEFPNDPLYSRGQLTATKLTQTAFPIVSPAEDIKYTMRDSFNRVDVFLDTTEYTEYKLDKAVPTVSDTIIDDLLDDEWEFFVNEGQLREPTVSGLFLIGKEIQLNPIDFHHAYITKGPENLADLISNSNNASDVISDIFCVYYINNDVAYPIPNYKTLEVMLVERGLTYSSIKEADNDQIRKFDMVFDGKFEGDQTPNTAPDPVEEFNFRKLTDRTLDWNTKVRFDSGYRPKAPFKRDPGDYLKPIGYRGTGASDLYITEDPNDRYFDLVFQGQTYKEKLREKYEGKMVIDKWPVPYNNDAVVQNVAVSTDDLVLGVRLMINGYWKGIAIASEGGSRVFETYAQVNGYSLKDFQVGQGRYGERGYINLLLDQGGLTVLHVQEDERPSAVWDDFAHIAEVDRLDPSEYLDYIDNYSNNGQPFDIDYLNPYEPKGSITYYNQVQLDKLQMQATEQAAFDNIKEQILEYWPKLATRTEEFKNRINGLQSSTYESYFARMLGDNCPAYRIINSDDYWRLVKRKRKDGLKVKEEEKNLLSLIEKANIITLSINKDQENSIVSSTRWGRVVAIPGGEEESDSTGADVAEGVGIGVVIGAGATAGAVAAGGAGLLALGGFGAVSGAIVGVGLGALIPVGTAVLAAGLLITGGVLAAKELRELDNIDKYELPRRNDGSRFKKLMKAGEYINLMIASVMEEDITNDGIRDRLYYADSVIGELRDTIQEATELLLNLDNRLFNATEVDELRDIYTSIMEFYAFLTSINNDDLQYCINTKNEIDRLLRKELSRIYEGIETFRQIVYENVGNRNKFGIQWPESAKSIINTYLPGKSFDNYLPQEED